MTDAKRENRLARETSPYLRQHAHNPVDWYSWGEEALRLAREEGRPIFLSIGYSSCHWCHVMERESFEDESVAALMNELFVNIKVDREERPDLDEIYMAATQMLTGQGGWPNSVFLTPDLKPFFAGTYFPPAPRWGRPGFADVLRAAADAFRSKNDDVRRMADEVTAQIARLSEMTPSAQPLAPAILNRAFGDLAGRFDNDEGGFGGAPKFPHSMDVSFLLRYHRRTGNPEALRMAVLSLEKMARGGIHDQLGGGFHRYAVDAKWLVPHFEKMLYDNALLLRVYLHWWRLRRSALAERIARETAGFLLRDMRTPQGGFASALDADTDGVEGLTYVWTRAQLHEVLGADADAAAELFAVTPTGTFEHGASTLQLPRDPSDRPQWTDWRTRLLEARNLRPQPGRDDKVVTAWNGLVIAALAEAGALFDEPSYVDVAQECAELMLCTHIRDGRLRRTSRDGRAGTAAGVAEDYGDLAEGLLALHQATADPRWLDTAGQLLDTALARFADGSGGFFDTADDAERLVRRPKDPTDNAAPSGQSAVANALVTYSALTGSLEHRRAAEHALRPASSLGVQQPRFLGWALAAGEALVSGPLQVAIVGESGRGPLTSTAWMRRPPGAVVLSGSPDAPGMPLLAARPLVRDAAAAYVCRGMVCDAPVTDVAALEAAIR